jgi:hypothetical protein
MRRENGKIGVARWRIRPTLELTLATARGASARAFSEHQTNAFGYRRDHQRDHQSEHDACQLRWTIECKSTLNSGG